MSFAERLSPLRSLWSRVTLAAFVFASGLALVLMAILALGTWRTLVWQEEQVLLQRSEALYSWLSADPIDEDNLFHEITENVFAPREILMRVEDPALSEPLETPDFTASLYYVPSAAPTGRRSRAQGTDRRRRRSPALAIRPGRRTTSRLASSRPRQ